MGSIYTEIAIKGKSSGFIMRFNPEQEVFIATLDKNGEAGESFCSSDPKNIIETIADQLGYRVKIYDKPSASTSPWQYRFSENLWSEIAAILNSKRSSDDRGHARYIFESGLIDEFIKIGSDGYIVTDLGKIHDVEDSK